MGGLAGGLCRRSPAGMAGSGAARRNEPIDVRAALTCRSDLIIFVDERCRIVAEADADEMKAYLEGVTPDPGIWSFRDETGGVQFQVSPLAPHESGCTPRISTGVAPARNNLIRDMRVCDYLPVSLTAEVCRSRGRHSASRMRNSAKGAGPPARYWQGWLFASRHRVSSNEAEPIVQAQFGTDFTTDVIAGRTVFFNACAAGADDCEPQSRCRLTRIWSSSLRRIPTLPRRCSGFSPKS